MPFEVADVIANVKYIHNGDYRPNRGRLCPPPPSQNFFANIGCFLFRSKKEIVHFMSLEVPHERVIIMGELGRGAFGKVHKGVMKEVTNANIYPDTSERNPNVHSKDSLRTLKDNEGRIVAVKVLLGELLRHFRRMFTNHVQPARC